MLMPGASKPEGINCMGILWYAIEPTTRSAISIIITDIGRSIAMRDSIKYIH